MVLAASVLTARGCVGTFELAATTPDIRLGITQSLALALATMVHLTAVVPIARAGVVALLSSGIRHGRLVTATEEVNRASA